MSKTDDYLFWFNQNPTLAFPCGLISYGDHIDDNGSTYTSAAFLNGETFRIYGTEEERKQKYHQMGLALMGIESQTTKSETHTKN